MKLWTVNGNILGLSMIKEGRFIYDPTEFLCPFDNKYQRCIIMINKLIEINRVPVNL